MTATGSCDAEQFAILDVGGFPAFFLGRKDGKELVGLLALGKSRGVSIAGA